MDTLIAGNPKPSAEVGRKIESLQLELHQWETDNQATESSVEALKRQKVHEAFEVQFDAMRKMGEKLAIISGYGKVLVQGLGEPGATPYDPSRAASVRELVAEDLKNWTPATARIPLPDLSRSSALHRGDTR